MRAGPAPRPAHRALEVVVLGVAAYAVLLVAAGPAAQRLFELLGFGADDAVAAGDATDYVLFLQGVLGAVIVGWMLLLLAVVRGPLRRQERWAWNAIALSTVAWFVVDTGFSLVVDQPEHALFNVAFLALLGVPLAALRPEVQSSSV